MNILEKLYCRVFQFGFKLAIPILPYRNPNILNQVDQIPKLLKEKDLCSVLLVTDPSIRGLGLTKHLEEILKKNGIKTAVYDKVQPNPTVSTVEEARQLYLQQDCKALIGFGGGSSMDTAKAVGALIARPNSTLEDLGGILRVWLRTPYTIAIPTTAGTGSETTVAAVILDDESGHKYALMDFPLIPDVAVLDPETTRTLPPRITAGTGMDTLAHAVEAYIGNSTTKLTRREALRAVRLVFKYLERAVKNGNDMKARRGMLRASYLGGCAFTVSYVGYAHAVSHSLSGQYNLPHGETTAILLPYVLEAYGTSIYPQLKALAIAAGVAHMDTEEALAAQSFIRAVWELNRKIGIGTRIPGIKKEDITKMARMAAKEGNPVYPVPVLMDAKALERFYYDVYEEGGTRS
ncbi:MAG: iron-containing alcohol dehydrogenase [Lachnospiraceae bacterium]|nr:iron-containing alcohol dehydrogenase [Lachnospiraceae bacterium]